MKIGHPGVALLLLLAAALATAQSTDIAAVSVPASNDASASEVSPEISSPDSDAEQQLQVTSAGLAARPCDACSTSAFQPVCGALPGAPGLRHTIMNPCLAACQGVTQFTYGACSAAGVEGAATASGAGASSQGAAFAAKLPELVPPPPTAAAAAAAGASASLASAAAVAARYAADGYLFMGYLQPAAATGASTPANTPALRRPQDLVKRLTEPMLVMTHRADFDLVSGLMQYYVRAERTSLRAIASRGRRMAQPATPGMPPAPMPTLSTAVVAAAAAADNSSTTVFIPAAQLAAAAAAAAAATQEEIVASPDDIAVGRKLKQQFTIPDNRQRITPTTSWPHMAMGKLVFDLDANRTNYGCSAAFISPDEILTAGHCTLDAASGRPYNLRSFAPGKDDALEPMGRLTITGIVWASGWVGAPYTAEDGQTPGSAYLDVAVQRMSRPMTTWLPFGPVCGPRVHNLRSCGYPADKGFNQLWCSSGTTLVNDLCDATLNTLQSDSSIFIQGGMSGGPVMDTTTGTNVIRGVNSGIFFYGSDPARLSVSIFAPIDVANYGWLTSGTQTLWATTWRFRLGTPGAIRSRASAKCMHLASITPATPVTMQPCSNTTNQNQWVRSFAGSMELRVGTTGLCLDLGGSSFANGTPLLVNTCNNTNQQRFFYDRQGRLRPILSPAKCVDLASGSLADGVGLVLGDCSSGDSVTPTQQWY